MSKFLLSCVLSCAFVLLLAGCGSQLQPSAVMEPGTASVGALQGSVHGGQPPVAGAHVYLYESVATGYGSAAHSLLGAAGNTTTDGTNYYVTTDGGGSFSLTGDYTCTTGAQVYALALGGNAGGGANPGIGLMAGLGQCPGTRTLASQVPFVTVNEVTTVAAAYGLAGFMLTPTQLAINNTTLGVTGLANAMANALNIVNIATGTAPAATLAAGSNGTVPQAKIYTLANILASCVNSSGPASTPCTSLFAAATSNGASTGTPPGNTAQAILNIAHYPGSNVATLYSLSPSTPVFAPTLTTAPNDFLLPVTYSPITAVQNGLAIDVAGNAWVAGGNLVGRITPLGVSSLIYTGLAASTYNHSSVAVAPNGNTWVSDSSGNTVTVVNSGGLVVTTAGGLGGLNGPSGIAFDSSGNAFIENNLGNSVTFLTSAATVYTASAVPSADTAYQIAVDGSNRAWVSSYDSAVKRVTQGATAATPFSALTRYNQAVAIDASNSVWLGGDSGSSASIARLGSDGTLQGTYTGGGVSTVDDVAQLAIDGGGNVWGIGATHNFAYSYSNFVEIANSGTALSPSSGFQNASGYGNLAIALDGSGDVWVTNANRTTTEFLGASVPVSTPMFPGQLGAKP